MKKKLAPDNETLKSLIPSFQYFDASHDWRGKYVRGGLLTPPPMVAMGRKGGPRDTRTIDPMIGHYMALDRPPNANQPKDSEGDGDGDKDSGTPSQ
ncbi:hypothetical protein U1Q18_028736 [Sarracenia purpurea var. burkii]